MDSFRLPPQSPKPDFFIVGAPKCATTAMCTYLAQHPEIFIPRIKEPDFFGSDLPGVRAARTEAEYLNLFRDGGGKLCGEGSVWNLFSRRAAKEIYDFNPEAKIIIMLREPVELLRSLHNELIFQGREDIEDFQEALLAETERRKGNRIPSRCTRFGLLYSDVVKFSEQIGRYFDIFEKENIHIVIYDDLVANIEVVYRDILEFLRVDPTFQPEFEIINRSKRFRSRGIRWLLRSIALCLRYERLSAHWCRKNGTMIWPQLSGHTTPSRSTGRPSRATSMRGCLSGSGQRSNS